MLAFLEKLWQTPSRAILTQWIAVATGIVVVQLAGPSTDLRLPAKTATELLLLTGALLFSLGGVAYSYWKKCQPRAQIEWARNNGRFICACTEIGAVMLLAPPPDSGVGVKVYY